MHFALYNGTAVMVLLVVFIVGYLIGYMVGKNK